jgi:hypothetical protein
LGDDGELNRAERAILAEIQHLPYKVVMTITLYELQPSPHARKVRLLAAELGIPLNKFACDPRIGETRNP